MSLISRSRPIVAHLLPILSCGVDSADAGTPPTVDVFAEGSGSRWMQLSKSARSNNRERHAYERTILNNCDHELDAAAPPELHREPQEEHEHRAVCHAEDYQRSADLWGGARE